MAGSTSNPPKSHQLGGDRGDALIAYGVCGFILLILLAFALMFDPKSPSPAMLTILCGAGGSALGWATGIFSSPYDASEEKKFRGLAKAVYAFVTGYALAKLDPMLTLFIDQTKTSGISIQAMSNTAVAVVAFVTVATATYASRKYWP